MDQIKIGKFIAATRTAKTNTRRVSRKNRSNR